MKDTKKEEIINNMVNGNLSDFRKSVVKMSKKDMLDVIEYYSGNFGGRHIIINHMRLALLTK